MSTVTAGGIIDIEIKGTTPLANPFFAGIEGRFSGPGGRELRIPGFYDGEGTWKVRFSPTEAGEWSYTIRSMSIADADGMSGTVTCVPSDSGYRGTVKVSDTHPLHFSFEDGTPHFMNAYECDWLWAMDLGGDPALTKTREMVGIIKESAFNTVIMNVYAHDSSWTPGKTSEYDYGPPAMFPWMGDNEEPDHTRMNIAFWRHLDAVVTLLADEGIMIHLFIKVYNKQVNWPERHSPEDDLYFRYCAARYQAYWNITWDFSKESKNEANKDYLYDRINFIKHTDAYRHMITTHDDPGYFTDENRRRSVDFYTAQHHQHFYDMAISTLHRYGIPYFNSEFGYEHGPGGIDDKTYGVSQTPEELVKRAYEVVMAGGYPAYYYTYTAWDVINPNYRPPGYRYFAILYRFFTSIRWWEFEPMPEYSHPNMSRCLSRGQDELVIFTSDDRNRNRVFMTADLEFEHYRGFWMDIFTGERIEFTPAMVHRNELGLAHIEIPFESRVGVLHLRSVTQRGDGFAVSADTT